ncbi:MAG TPA: PilN domain-containing protein [Gemmatimonadaceae bacterium]|nr:PilN domain-containing protein [Gemmatimonadaceae bacterium]
MATMVGARSGAHVGIALSATSVCAVIRGAHGASQRPWRMSLSPLNGDGAAWPGLTDALRALARDAGISEGQLTVALLPPLAEARGIELPPLREAEIQQLLARSAAKYFVGARGAQVVGAVRAKSPTGPATTVAAAASARLVSAIHEAARNAGWTVDAVVPAEAAWCAAGSTWAPRGRASANLLIAHADRTDLLHIADGRLAGVRRFRRGSADAALIADASAGVGHASVVGNADARRELTQSLSSRGLAVDAPTTGVSEIAEDPELLAAAFATSDAEPALVTDAMRAAHAESLRKLIVRIAGVAAVITVIAGVLELWGAKRELASLNEQRAQITPMLSATLVGRTTVEAAYRQLAALNGAEQSAPRWSAVLAQVSARLPKEAYLTGFRGRGDTVTIDGLAERAARVFDAIEKAPLLANVRATAPVRIENLEDGRTLERFTIAGRRAAAAPPARAGGSQ